MELDPSMYAVFATFVVRPGSADAVADLLSKHIAATRGELGCVTAFANRDADDPQIFRMYEVFTDESTFQKHVESPHYAEYVAAGIRPLLSERVVARAHPLV